MRFGTWNIKTIMGKEPEIVNEMRDRKLELLGLSEVRKKGSGTKIIEGGYTLRYSGVVIDRRAKEGVGVVTSPECESKVSNWYAVNSRIMVVNLELDVPMAFVQVYAPTEDMTVLEKEEFYVELQRVLDKETTEGREVMIAGDMNARTGNDPRIAHGVMGRYGGERTVNENGKRMIEFCIENQLLIGNSIFPHKTAHKITFEAEGRNAKSVIDYILFSNTIRRNILDVKVIRGAEMSTDHRLLIVDTRFRNIKRQRNKKYQQIKISELTKDDKRQEYERLVTQKLEQFKEEEDLNVMWTKFKDTLLESATRICGRITVNTKRKSTPWWNNEVKEKVREKKEAWKVAVRTQRVEDRAEYVRLRNEAKAAVKASKTKSWEEFGNTVESKAREKDTKQFWKIVKSLRGKYGKSIRSIKEGNKLMTGKEEVLEAWQKHYRKIFEDDDKVDTSITYGPYLEVQNEDIEGEIHQMEVISAIARMKIGKAAGADGIAPELIKYGGPEMMRVLTRIFQKAWNHNKIPDEWRQNLIIPIHKKGNSWDCNNYRAICLSSIVYKLYTRILERRLRKVVEDEMEEEQAAFREGRQTQDHLFTIRTAMEKNIEKNRDMFLAFLDLKAAFDSVPRHHIWTALAAKQVPMRLINAIKSIYHEPIGKVRLDGELSAEFGIERGVKQGDSLSPLLFNIFMDEITKRCKRRTHRTQIGNWRLRPVYLQVLLYADDIILVADRQERLQQAVEEWNEELKLKGMTINTEKSKVMWVSKKDKSEEDLLILCEGKVLERVESFEYLGSILTSDGRIDQEILHRTKKGMSAYFQICNTIVGKKEISTKTKMQLYTSVISPIVLYGTESLPFQDKHITKMTAVEMRYLRRTVGKTRRDRIRNEQIREEVKQKKTLSDIVEERQLKWYGHVQRMDEGRKVKQVQEMGVEGRVGRGRPRITWQNRIERIGEKRGKTLVEMKRMSRDRKSWRRWTTGAMPDA